VLRTHGFLGGKVTFRRRAKHRMQQSGYIGDCIAGLWSLAFKFLSDIIGRFRDQLLERVPWDVLPTPKMLSEDGVILGTLNQMQEARM
jgi:hypothetical protein